jgi:enoyl-CoA hydratase/carnithine racemase
MTKRFLDLLDSAECDDRVRCVRSRVKPSQEKITRIYHISQVLLTGSGKFFCLGVDMEQLEMLEDQYGRPFYYARLVPKPVICALNGSAAGIGLALACHCDVRFCAHDAKLTVAYPRRGLVLEHGLSWALERICGMGHAMDLSLTGRRVNAKEAHRMGLVNFVVNRDELIAQATKYANDLAQNVSPGAMAAAKFQVLKHPSMSMRDSLNESNKMMHTSEKCDDLQEGFKSFQEKRPPKFEPVHSKHPLLPSRYERSML